MPHIQLRDIVAYYEEAGSGPALLCIAGLGGHAGVWAPHLRALATTRRVITFDNRGAGRTSAPDKPYSINGMAEDACQLLDRLNIEKASVAGYGMGASIALELAADHGERVDKLVLIGATARVGGRQRVVTEGWVAARRSNMSREAATALTIPWLYTPALLADDTLREQAIESGARDPHPTGDHAYARQANALLAYDATERLAGIEHSTLVLHGEDDILVNAADAAALAEGLPNGSIETLPGAHAGLVETANPYTAAINTFLG